MYVELYFSSTRGDCNMICWFKQECSHLMPASLVYSKSVIECLLHCLLNIPRNIGDAFFYVITCVYTSWKNVVLLFLFHVLDCNAIFANQDLLPTLRPGNFDLHTKMPGAAPAWAVVTELYYISGDRALAKKVWQKTWRISFPKELLRSLDSCCQPLTMLRCLWAQNSHPPDTTLTFEGARTIEL